MKKLDNVKRDHEKRLNELQTEQLADEKKAHIIQINLDIVSCHCIQSTQCTQSSERVVLSG